MHCILKIMASTICLMSSTMLTAAPNEYVGDGEFSDFSLEQSGEKIILYIAKKPTNEPLMDAKISLNLENAKQPVNFSKTANPGVYEADAHEILELKSASVIIEVGENTDAVEIKPASASNQEPPMNNKIVEGFPHTLFWIFTLLAVGALGLFGYLIILKKMRASGVLLMLVSTSVFIGSKSQPVFAHGGHDHGGPSLETVEAGSEIKLPKKSQFILGLRTYEAKQSSVAEALINQGHVIPKPEFDAVISSPQPGFLRLAQGITIGRKVKKGERLGVVDAVSEIQLISPLDGEIIELDTSSGVRVDAGAKILRITNATTVWVDAELFASDLIKLKDAKSAFITVDGIVEAFPARLTGAISAISEETRTAKVYLEVDNKAGLLRIGSFATINFQLMQKTSAITVPSSAVLNLNGEALIFVQTGPQTFTQKSVATTETSVPNMVKIISGINEGDRVVTVGNYQLLMKAK